MPKSQIKSAAKSDKLKLAIAKARQAAFYALQGGGYREAAGACEKAAKAQKRLFKVERSRHARLKKKRRVRG